MSYTYTFLLTGLPVTIQARTLQSARLLALSRWLRAPGPDAFSLPLVPPIILASTTDPRSVHELQDDRLKPPEAVSEGSNDLSNVTPLFK